ncbi:hypothetical protein GUITHDRAFT_149172 [Guillardia theta CCMP2712]|uniref:Uncharacterized protein n=1 Tax=Guillardia theta (strain CCMP2712) TaxID=905079 RepID=L1I5W8_GUITC|nr:hypothetical protein GUITHDRAFT_149172 [Guillardia theta CCMP2712]EKX31641.1 hypothetical protein GUITHDRAFT_149172 [Guillardia theta CCMP2712]|eukprot:XP_005818621.1 hypothetical protein GUITHDRAFT_149172 [Guillardia theta CCMP2712]
MVGKERSGAREEEEEEEVGAKPLMPLHPRGDEQEDVALPMPREFRRTYEPCPSNVEPQLTLKSPPLCNQDLACWVAGSWFAGCGCLGRRSRGVMGSRWLERRLTGRCLEQEMGARPEVCLGLKDSGQVITFFFFYFKSDLLENDSLLEQLAKLRCRCASMAASEAVGCYLNSASGACVQVKSFKIDCWAAEMNSNELQSLECKSEIEVGWASTIDYISQVLTSLGWHVEYDQFTAETPLGSKPMKSVIASFSPQGGDCILDLAGATDSAAPMGMMLSLAERLTPLLQRKLSADGALPVKLRPLTRWFSSALLRLP